MSNSLRARIEGAFVGLLVVAVFALFWLALRPGLAHVVQASAAPDPVSGWSTERLMESLGDYDQKMDCASLGLDGLSGYVWVSVDGLTGQPTRFLFICKP